MSGQTKEWLVFFGFLFLAVALTFAETIWLNRKGWTNFGKAFAFAVATNVFGFFVGFFVMFVVFGMILAMAWDGSLEKIPFGDAGLIAAIVFGVLFFPIFLALCKRLLLKILKIQTGKSAWIFSFLSSFSIVLFALGIPVLFIYLMF